MLERNQNIFTKVKLNLKTNPLNKDLFRKADIVQNEIFSSGDIERDFKIILVKGKEYYDFAGKEALIIKSILPSWEGGEIELVPDGKWKKYRNATGSYPCYGTIFNRKLYLSPVPVQSDDYIEIWAYQTKVIVGMDEEVPPELPETLDDALMWGICAQYDPGFADKYMAVLETQLSNLVMKKEEMADPEWDW